MTPTGLPFPLEGSTLIVGPSGVGKTRLTARALSTWLDQHGPAGVVILDFGPEVEHQGKILGGRLDRFVDIPDSVWYAHLESNAPRAKGEDPAEIRHLASENAEGGRRLLEDAPDQPMAVFVNDVTLIAHVPDNPLEDLLDYSSEGRCTVLNAYEGTSLGGDDPISTQERRTVARLRRWADREIRLTDE